MYEVFTRSVRISLPFSAIMEYTFYLTPSWDSGLFYFGAQPETPTYFGNINKPFKRVSSFMSCLGQTHYFFSVVGWEVATASRR